MKRFTLFLLIAFCFNIVLLKAQQPGYNYTFLDLMDYVTRHNKIMTFRDPYLNNEFIEGQILTKDNVILKGRLRYNMYADEMEFIVKDNVYWIDNQDRIETIKYADHSFIYYLKGEDKFDKGDYYEVMVDGPAKLLLRRRVILLDAVPAKPYQDPKPPRFENQRDAFYLMRFQGEPEKISSKKELLKLMSDKQNDIKSFIKKNKISTNKLDDLIQVVSYYNGL
mgnify:FL=1